MDSNRAVVGVVVAVVGIFGLLLGYRFLVDHWEDIKSLAIIALVFGGTITFAIGGLKFRARG